MLWKGGMMLKLILCIKADDRMILLIIMSKDLKVSRDIRQIVFKVGEYKQE